MHIDEPNEFGWTGLIVACFNQHHNIAAYLVELGANINATNHKGTTVFMYAKTPVFESKDTTILEWLLKNGAEINTKDMFGKTVLDYVLLKDANWLADWLKERGAIKG